MCRTPPPQPRSVTEETVLVAQYHVSEEDGCYEILFPDAESLTVAAQERSRILGDMLAARKVTITLPSAAELANRRHRTAKVQPNSAGQTLRLPSTVRRPMHVQAATTAPHGDK